MPYKILWVIMVFLGAMLKLKLVWTFSDVMNVLMAVPNLIALLFLANVIKQETEDYFKNYRKNIS
jgi:AGCS family alanine or glycine:cation symporter